MKTKILLISVMMMGWAVSSAQSESASRFRFDPDHTQIAFIVDRFGFTNIMGAFGRVEGTVVLDRDNPENSEVQATIHIDSLQSNHQLRTEHVTGPRWLNATEYPVARFVSTSVEQTSDTTAQVQGNLTLLGTTQPVTLDVTLNRIGTDPVSQKQAAGFSASTSLTRSDFGLETAMGLVGEDVMIRIEALALAEN